MSVFQKRRVAVVWVPVAVVGILLYLLSVPLSLTLNGLGTAGLGVAVLALFGAVADDVAVRRGWIR